MEQLVGKTLGQYQIMAEVGHGGMATVYRGYQTSLNRSVAVKVLAGELARNAGFRERFQREAHAVAQLAHPNILPVYDFGEDQASGMVYLVTQFVDGGTLAMRMKNRLHPNQAARIAAQVARALDCAHARGIVHRDVKPGNVLMTRDDHPLLADFGIAKIMADTQLTQTGVSIGTPQYMSPEQAQGLPADHRSDIYALGVMLYEMLAGVLPFQADTPVGLLHQHIHQPPPRLRERAPQVSKRLEKIVLRALAKDPAGRFVTAGEMADALEDEVAGRRKLFDMGRGPAQGTFERTQATALPAPGSETEAVGSWPVPPPAARMPAAIARPLTRLSRALSKRQVGQATVSVGRWLLRTVLSALAVLVVVGSVLLVGTAFALGAVAEQVLSSQRWVFDNLEPGYTERVACADIQQGVSQALQPYLLGALTDVEAECRPPDLVELGGRFRGTPISLSVRLRAVNHVPAIQLERLNNVSLYLVGGLVSDGVNRGMVKSWANASVRVSSFSVSEDGIEMVYEENPMR
jgi:hypothetical protein